METTTMGLGLRVIWGYVVVSLNYSSQNGGNVYRAPYYNRNLKGI